MIKDQRIPYFYVIQDKVSGMKYAGAKWGKDANPDKFMQDVANNYTTSSTTINDILKESPGVQFTILELIEESELSEIPFGGNDIYLYEQWFIDHNACVSSDNWLNFNSGGNSPTASEEVVQKAKDTCQMKYGGNSSMCDGTTVNLRRENNFKKYGGHPMSTDEVKDKHISTCMKQCGYTNYAKIAYICEHCGIKGRGVGNYVKYHHNNCKHNPGIFSEERVGLLLFPVDQDNPFGE